MERIPKPGEFYRHFKNKLYQILTVATHSETGEKLVVYQALYGEFGVYARPFAQFVSEVDHEKYPEVTQKYRFERVELTAAHALEDTQEQSEVSETWKEPCEADEKAAADMEMLEAQEPELSPLILPFIETDDYDCRMELLTAMTGKVGQKELDILYVALDLPQRGGEIDEQIQGIRRYLEMQRHFDGNRLR